MAHETDQARRELRDMLMDVALDRLVEYPRQGEYRFHAELRIPAAAALLRDIHAERMEMTETLAAALEECVGRLPEEG